VHNARLAKIHRTYSVVEIAELLGTHRNTVRVWLKAGLQPLDGRKPILVHGEELRRFLTTRRNAKRHSCAPGQMYCFRCRAPKYPAGSMADYQPQTPELGNLAGLCPDCEGFMYRRVNANRIRESTGDLEVMFPQDHLRIGKP
jgi:hypothetical protein